MKYSSVNLASDTLGPAAVMECFRNTAMAATGLDPIYYFIAPNFLWDVMLRNVCKKDGERGYNTKLKGLPLRLTLLSDSKKV